jgi:hypothetical protein
MRMANRLAVVFLAGGVGIGPSLSLLAVQAAPQSTTVMPPFGVAQSTPPKGTAFVVGQVLDGNSSKPIGGALVTLTISSTSSSTQGAPGGLPTRGGPVPSGQAPAGSSQSQFTNTARVLADGEGRFLFHDLPPGRVTLSASAPGYTSGNYGARRPTDASRPITLAEGQHFTDGTIRMWRLSAMSGTILDEAGEPLVGVTVTLQRFQLANGVKRPLSMSTTQTDDRGFYHFAMNSGEFLVAVPATATSTPVASSDAYQRAIASGQADEMIRTLASSGGPPLTNGGGFRIGATQYQASGGLGRNAPPISADGPLLAYQTTYYPSAVSVSQAQVITLGPGEERGSVDLTMRLNSTARVMGTITGPEGTTGLLAVRLVTSDGRDSTFAAQFPVANSVTEPTGEFTLLGVPSGQYELQATRIPRPEIINGTPSANSAPTYWARVPVNVGAADVAGLTVALRPGVRVSGRLEFDGNATRPTQDRIAQGSVNLQDLDGQNQPLLPNRFSSDGQFTTQGVLPGHYVLNLGVFFPGWTLKSVMANNHDLSASPQLIDGDVTNAVIMLTDHPNQVDGTVQAGLAASDSPSAVVYFPANYQAWLTGGTAGRLSGTIRIGQSSQFKVSGLPAGDYCFAAIPADLLGNWQDPQTLETISRGGTRVQIGDDDHRSIELKPVVIK